MYCDECPNKDRCTILDQFEERGKLIQEKDIERLKELYYLLELHESHASELRKRVLRELNHIQD